MPKNSLDAKVALVTGAARRIGAEISRVLHAAGMNIVLHYNASKEAATALCDELNQIRPHSAVLVCAELSERGCEKALIQQAGEAWQRLDVLVNNASRFYRTFVGEVTDQAWDDLINSNLRAPFFLSQAAAPLLAATKGAIINITDIHAQRPLAEYPVYCISKSGLLMMT
ncbi:MAG: SDR family NAD(P)-dependent oxidoreductase, partial [Gammaproteobacteria bacterium]